MKIRITQYKCFICNREIRFWQRYHDFTDKQAHIKCLKDSGGSKSVVEGQDSNLPPSVKLTDTEEKLPELTCPFCGRKLIRYKQAWICGHGCTKPALKPIDDLEKDSRSEKELPNRETAFYEASYGINGKPNVPGSKLPEPKEEKCRLIKNAKNDPNWDGSLNAELCKGDCETCPYNEPKANEPEKDYIKKSSIFVGNYYYPCNVVACPVKEAVLSYEGNNYCIKHFLEFIQYDAKKELIGRFIKFIDHFEERYEGNKCGECLEYWKTIKEHYKGA